MVGVGNQGAYNWGQLAGVPTCEVVALCDVDERMTAAARKRFPKAAFFTDYRKMIEAKGLDAVLCATPDHHHFHVTHMALSHGLHTYCEKPLTHTVAEARAVAELAAKKKLVTQMGTQIHAGDNYRRVVEIIRKGVIGQVKEAHCWVGGAFNGNGKRPASKPVPKELNWDLWLGPAAERPYAPEYVPFYWRRFWAFGGGKMADMACHHMDLPFWALDLHHPTSVSAKGSPVTPETGADWIICKFEFPARGDKPPVTLTWYDGDKRPPHFAKGILPKWGDGTLFVGEKGMLLAGYGQTRVASGGEVQGRRWRRVDPKIDRPSQGVDRSDPFRWHDHMQLPLLGSARGIRAPRRRFVPFRQIIRLGCKITQGERAPKQMRSFIRRTGRGGRFESRSPGGVAGSIVVVVQPRLFQEVNRCPRESRSNCRRISRLPASDDFRCRNTTD